MVLRTKTIEYAFPTYATAVAAGIEYQFAAITLYIPETTSRSFLNVSVEIAYRGNETAATSGTNPRIGIKLGAIDFDYETITDTITNSGEQQTGIRHRDITSYFTTNFGTGTSQTCQVSWTMTTLPTINITCKLIITYQFDDANQTTRIKTVKIPLESFTAVLTATLTAMGSNQVPQLTGSGSPFLPENSITVRDIFFEIYGNEATNAVTDFYLAVALDSEAEVQFFIECGLNSACFDVIIWKRTDMSTTVLHAFKMRSTLASRFFAPAVILHVTYEYNHTNSDTILNSITVACGEVTGYLGGTTATDCSSTTMQWFIQEPGTITLKQSGLMVSFNAYQNCNFYIKVGTQAYRTYTHIAGALTCGGFATCQRVDSGSAQGAGISIARGLNAITYSAYGATASTITNFTGQLFLNYTSGKSAAGADAHTQTRRYLLMATPPDAIELETAAVAPVIAESNYWIVGASYLLYVMFTLAAGAVSFKTQIAANSGWSEIYESYFQTDIELGITRIVIRGKDIFKRYPTDPDTSRLPITTARKYRLTCGITHWSSILVYLTFHSLTYTVNGTVSGYTGDGSGITVEVHRTDNDEKVLSLTTSAGGGYSGTWYDNTIPLKCDARQSDVLCGRSTDGVAV